MRADHRVVRVAEDRTRRWLLAAALVASPLGIELVVDLATGGARTGNGRVIVGLSWVLTVVIAVVLMTRSWALVIDTRARVATLSRRFWWVPYRRHRTPIGAGVAIGDGFVTVTERQRPEWLNAIGCVLGLANGLLGVVFMFIGRLESREVAAFGLIAADERESAAPARLLLAVRDTASAERALAKLREIAPRLVR